MKRQFPLGVKLAIIIGFIVIASLGTVTFINSYFVSKDLRLTADENNLTINTRSASTAQNELDSVRLNALQLLDLINAVGGGRNSVLAKQAESFFFERNSDVAEILLLTKDSDQENVAIQYSLKNLRFFFSNGNWFSKLFSTELITSQTDFFINIAITTAITIQYPHSIIFLTFGFI